MHRALAAFALLLSWHGVAMAGEAASPEAPAAASSQVVLLHTVVTASATQAGTKALTRDPQLVARARQLDQVLTDAAQDLGFTLDLSERVTEADREWTDLELVTRAAHGGSWVVYPTIETSASDFVVRLVAVPPGSKVASVSTESVKASDLAIRAVVMLRDVMAARPTAASTEPARRPADHVEPPHALAVPARSRGQSVLALNAALFGSFIGYSVESSSGSDDPRLLFPLMALGTGLGLGASTIVAEEWDVGIGDAWYLSAAAWWPALAGLFVARSRTMPDPATEHSYALISAVSGLGLATTSLALGGGMSEGGALLTHSGGAFGTLFGAMTEFAVRGEAPPNVDPPYRGLGYGAGIGVVIAGAAAIRNDIEPSRVLALDLGAGLGGLAGAAATSPFLFRQRTATGDRVFLISTMASTLAGGTAAYFLTRKPASEPTSTTFVYPFAGPIGESITPSGSRVPALGVALCGTLP
jgi:hypothetical protein